MMLSQRVFYWLSFLLPVFVLCPNYGHAAQKRGRKAESLCQFRLNSSVLEQKQRKKQLLAASKNIIHKVFKVRNSLIEPKLLLKLWRLNGLFRQEEFYEVLTEHEIDLGLLYETWYPSSKVSFDEVKDRLPEQYWVLALDPGISKRLTEFIEFSLKTLSRKPKISPLALRQAFSEKLGTKTYYRALAVDKRTAENLKTKGILPRAPQFHDYKFEVYQDAQSSEAVGSSLEMELYFWYRLLRKGPKADMLQRIRESGNETFSQSITSFAKVAIYAAKGFGKPGAPVYLFKLEVPVLEVVSSLEVTDLLGHKKFRAEGEDFYFDQPGVEHFVMGLIEPGWIKSMKSVGESNKDARFIEMYN